MLIFLFSFFFLSFFNQKILNRLDTYCVQGVSATFTPTHIAQQVQYTGLVWTGKHAERERQRARVQPRRVGVLPVGSIPYLKWSARSVRVPPAQHTFLFSFFSVSPKYRFWGRGVASPISCKPHHACISPEKSTCRKEMQIKWVPFFPVVNKGFFDADRWKDGGNRGNLFLLVAWRFFVSEYLFFCFFFEAPSTQRNVFFFFLYTQVLLCSLK